MKSFEFLNEDEGNLTIRNPDAARTIKKARAKYAHADTDVEALANLHHDEQSDDEQDITSMQHQLDSQDETIQNILNRLDQIEQTPLK